MFSFNFSPDRYFWLLMLILVIPGLAGIWLVPPEALILPVFVRAALSFIFVSISSLRHVPASRLLSNLLGLVSFIIFVILFGKMFLWAGEYYSSAIGLEFTESNINMSIMLSLFAILSLLYAFFMEERAIEGSMIRHQSEVFDGFALLMLFVLSTDIYGKAPLGAQLPLLTMSLLAIVYAVHRNLDRLIGPQWEIDQLLKFHLRLNRGAWILLLLPALMVSAAILVPSLTVPIAVAFISAGHLLKSE